MKTTLLTMCAMMAMLVCGGLASASPVTGYVATANGTNAFEITGGTQVYYHVQPDTDYNWYYPDGSLVTYTRNGVTANRDGMKTFAATDAAYGATLGSLKLNFQYYSDDNVDSNGYVYKNYPSINVHLTDGNGNYAIWSATSGGTGFTYETPVPGRPGWEQLVLDCTSFADTSTYGKINESTDQTVLANGNLSASKPWSAVKDWTIAGFYTEQFAPTGGWAAWGTTLWGDINEAGDIVPVNRYGISLVWGDTVGSMFGDYDNSYVGALAERDYGKGVKMIDNVVVTAAGNDYEVSFMADGAADPTMIPEPVTLTGLGLAAAGLAGYLRRRRN